MSRLLLGLAAVAVCAFGAVNLLFAEDAKEAKFDCKCPVSGAPAKETSSVDVHGKKVYFCCDNCPKAFAKDVEKFMPKVYVQWLATKQVVQVGCPISGGKLNPETAVDFAGTKIAFCCEKCQGKFAAASEDEKLALATGKADKAFTLQTACPVSGKPINAEVSVTHEGKKVYFCCPGCPGAFEKEPAKFLEKLPQFSTK